MQAKKKLTATRLNEYGFDKVIPAGQRPSKPNYKSPEVRLDPAKLQNQNQKVLASNLKPPDLANVRS